MWNPETYTDTDFGLEEGETFEPSMHEAEEPDMSISVPHIMTLLGPIPPEELGICLPHVHLLCDPPGEPEDYRLDDPDRAEAEIETFVTMNGRSLVECSTADAGRMIEPLREIAGWVPAHLIAVTGRHNHHFAARMPNALDVDSLATEFTRDLTEGMDGTPSRAGVIKVGISRDHLTDVERATINAAGRAHGQTGAPITTHTEEGTAVPHLLASLAEAGVASHRVIIGHVDRVAMSLESHTAMLETGAFIQFDQIGMSETYVDQQRAERIAALCQMGYDHQILLSLDYGRRSLQTSWDGQPGLSYLSEWFMVLLMECGLDALTIRRLVVDNPMRALTISPPGA